MDLRRVAAPGGDDTSDAALLAQIRTEVRRDGPLTFARFMEIALYDPERGYYRSRDARPGRAGDFLTAPEAHPIFGRALARFAAAVAAVLGDPRPVTIREIGAGTGALAGPLVAALAPRPVRYLIDEVEPARLDQARARIVVDRAHDDAAAIDVVLDDGRPIDGLVVANEVLDALPTHRVVQRAGALRELRVGVTDDGGLVDVESSPSPGIADRLAAEGITLADGQAAEVCLAVDAWMTRIAAGVRRGVVVLIDYGHPAAELYDGRRRPAGTLAAYQGHEVGFDPYRAVGHQDLTAHVDITAVVRAAAAAGLDHLGTTTQGVFLDELGAGDLLVAEQTRPGATLQAYLEARSAVVRMIDPAAMGGFKVIVLGRGLPPGTALPGLPNGSAQAG